MRGNRPYLNAFTLIELLVVMAIISFLIVGAWRAISYSLGKTRDYNHVNAVKAFNQAIVTYISEEGTAPDCSITAVYLRHSVYSHACSVYYLHTNKEEYINVRGRYTFQKHNIKPRSIAYYKIPGTTKYAICTLTMLSHSDGDKPNYYSPPPTAPDNAKGCFCLGPGADEVKCYGMNFYE